MLFMFEMARKPELYRWKSSIPSGSTAPTSDTQFDSYGYSHQIPAVSPQITVHRYRFQPCTQITIQTDVGAISWPYTLGLKAST